MKVSIITATYNRDTTISKAISSIKNQDYEDIQIIVIDGKSSDKTVSIVKPMLNDKDILKSEEDEGIYDALNKGINLADGDIIGFLHSDDLYFDKNVISKVINAFSKKDINVVYGDACFFAAGKTEKIVRRYVSGKFSVKNLAWGKMPAHPAIFIRREIFDQIGFFKTNFQIAGDYEFLSRLALYPKLKYIYMKEIFIKMQVGGISTSGLRNTILLNKEIMKALKLNSIYTNIFMLLSKYPSKIIQFLWK